MANQKHFLILIIIGASVASFLGGYLLTQPSGTSSAALEQQRGSLIDRFDGVVERTTPTPLPPGLLQASADPALALTNSPDGDAVLYYHPDSGYVSRLDLETRTSKTISSTTLSRLARVIWSQDKNRVVTITRTSSGSSYTYFDYTTKEHGNLGTNIADAAISPDGSRVAIARNPGGGEGAIQIADFDGKNLRTILKTRLTNIRLSWPDENKLVFTASDANSNTASLYALSESGDLIQMVSAAEGLGARWSSDGSQLLYSTQEDGGMAIWILDATTQKTKKIPIQTSPELCAWTQDQRSLICAVQAGGETSIIKISLIDFSTSVLFSHLIITPGEGFLSQSGTFFVLQNAADQSIWAVKLNQ